MQVRRPTADDAAAIARVYAASWRSAYRGLLPDELLDDIPTEPTDDQVVEWRDRIANDRDRMLVATAGGEVVGYAVVRLTDTKPFVGDDEAGLKEIYVHPGEWGEGVGSALLEAAIDALPEAVSQLRLETLAGNDLAAEFYEARDFERTAEGTAEIAGSEYPTEIYSRSLE